MTNERRSYQEKCEAELAEWNALLARMQTKADGADAGIRIEYDRTIDAMSCRRAEATARLGKLKDASDEDFAGMKPRAERTWDDIGTAFTNAALKVL